MLGWDEIRSWGSFVLAAGAVFYSWITSRSKTNAAEIKAVREDLKAHDRRIQKVEDTLEHMPTQSEVHALNLNISELNGRIGVLATKLEATENLVSLIDQTLLKPATGDPRGGAK